jgi:hypothetical protein
MKISMGKTTVDVILRAINANKVDIESEAYIGLKISDNLKIISSKKGDKKPTKRKKSQR